MESHAIGFDEFQRIGDQLERALLDSLISFPFVMLENADDCDPGSFVAIFGGYFSQRLETKGFDPCGILNQIDFGSLLVYRKDKKIMFLLKILVFGQKILT